MTPPEKKRSNTSSWVDQRYAKRLARQAVVTLDADRDDADALRKLATMRQSPLFLREERTRIGPGFKTGIRVWHLDTAVPQAEIDTYAPGRKTLPGIKVFTVDYDEKGTARLGRGAGALLANVSQHALERLFERLRTNALNDVVREALRPLSSLNSPEVENRGQETELPLPMLGVMHATVELTCDAGGKGVRAFWQIKTFVAHPTD